MKKKGMIFVCNVIFLRAATTNIGCFWFRLILMWERELGKRNFDLFFFVGFPYFSLMGPPRPSTKNSKRTRECKTILE